MSKPTRRLHVPIRWVTRAMRALPAALERLHLEWALKEIDPMHPDVPLIVRRINELQRSGT